MPERDDEWLHHHERRKPKEPSDWGIVAVVVVAMIFGLILGRLLTVCEQVPL